eukprot:gnl/Spiro4/23246_TR11487_c0_g1_i1.p1 gnl/Spiro4/23246_TR11487_c0_g1~~gnl/Spiro4/23246_TR11487_c0_g1_i1.p1  ORF type:complete len:375 (-),score=98.04 gnl/Spiro4/23246_TR11487_c0_g1_i1:519-1643(-)
MFFSLNSNYRWYVTGTPFPHGRSSMMGALHFLEYYTSSDCKGTESALYEETLFEAIRARYFWRNTKESVSAAKFVPAAVEQVFFLKLSDVERAMYNAAKVRSDLTHMRQLCCHPQISSQDRAVLGEEGKTLDEIRVAMQSHNINQLKSAQKYVIKRVTKLNKKTMKREKRLLKREKDDREAREKGKTIGREIIEDREKEDREWKRIEAKANKKLDKAHEDVKLLTAQGAIYKSLVPRAEEALKEPCLICFEDIAEAGITKCGHIFCMNCIKAVVRNRPSCPMCREDLTEADITAVRSESAAARAKPDELVMKHGSKMARLIRFLQSVLAADPENRAVVFFSVGQSADSDWRNALGGGYSVCLLSRQRPLPQCRH